MNVTLRVKDPVWNATLLILGEPAPWTRCIVTNWRRFSSGLYGATEGDFWKAARMNRKTFS